MATAQYGGYIHANNSLHPTRWERSIVYGSTGWPELLRIDTEWKAKLIDSTMAGCMAQAYQMQLAYSVGGQSFIFFDNFGNQTVWTLDSPSSIGGVQVTKPVTYGECKGAEGTTFLYATFGLSAEYLVTNGNLIEFSEQVSFEDNQGLPIQVEKMPLNAPVFVQNVTAGSFFYATQSGELWSPNQNPQPMQPSSGQFKQVPGSRRIFRKNPKIVRGNAYLYHVGWSYMFRSDGPIQIFPNVF
jgi:hypothetical protein